MAKAAKRPDRELTAKLLVSAHVALGSPVRIKNFREVIDHPECRVETNNRFENGVRALVFPVALEHDNGPHVDPYEALRSELIKRGWTPPAKPAPTETSPITVGVSEEVGG